VQPVTFWTRALWGATGELNEKYHYVLDWDWYLRATQVCAFEPMPGYLAMYRIHEAHKTGTGGAERAAEIVEVVERYSTPDWARAFRDTRDALPDVRHRLRLLRRLRLGRFPQLAHPALYAEHGRARIETALVMLRARLAPLGARHDGPDPTSSAFTTSSSRIT
jgi:hypothetical protein